MPSSPIVIGFDHVQITAPRADEARAKVFYAEVLGLVEVPKPEALAGRGGAWYRCGDLHLHLGIEADEAFHPQQKSHPAFLVCDLASLRALHERLAAAGAPLATDVPLPGYERFETRDPSGNRLEFLCRVAESA